LFGNAALLKLMSRILKLTVPCLFCCLSQPSLAWEWEDLWLNKDQLGQQAFEKEQFQTAVNQFESISWRAAANYRQGNYEAALTDLIGLNDIHSLYNRANTLAQLYRLPEAINTYRKVLDMNPEYADAVINLEIVAALLASMTDDPGTEFDVEREEGEEADTPPPAEQEEITAQTNGQENEVNQEDTSERLSQQESQDADGNTGTSQLENPESAEEQEFSAALEQQLTLQQWLGRIRDDPAALLRNKFEMQRRNEDALRFDLFAESNQQLW
jgi:Ca-activated chloride channel family protein